MLFAYATIFLFLGFPNWNGYGVGRHVLAVADASSLVAGLLFFPVLGNLRPDLVSFLPSMRQYAGNWASATWAFAPGAEAKLNRVKRSAGNQVDQLVAYGYEPQWAEIFTQQVIGWRSMHSQGRGLFSVLREEPRRISTREPCARPSSSATRSIGFNFGDGHLHDEDLIAAVQEQAQFAPGELVVAGSSRRPSRPATVQHYKVIDAALGVIERGTWKVADAVNEQPWLPNGPIPLQVTWTRPHD